MQESHILHEFFVVKGKMARYLSYKGYGFISVEGKDKDVFFHMSKFPSNRLPVQGQDLEFKLVETHRGPEAQDIRVLEIDEAVEQDTNDYSLSTDLTELSGVDPKHVEILNMSKVTNIEELSSYTPEILYANLISLNDETGITKKPPTLSQVEKWIEQASLVLQEV